MSLPHSVSPNQYDWYTVEKVLLWQTYNPYQQCSEYRKNKHYVIIIYNAGKSVVEVSSK